MRSYLRARRGPLVGHRVRIALVLSGLAAATMVMPDPARADGPGNGLPWVVSLGDSFISGEGGRWAGNSNSFPWWTDALGSDAYLDPGRSIEETFGCHRSRSAEIHIGGFVQSKNMACSGAKSFSAPGKPGVDFQGTGTSFSDGQASRLREFAKTHNVRMVVLSVGGNDFNFPDIVQACLTSYLTSGWPFRRFCKDNSNVLSNFTTANIDRQRLAIQTAISNVRRAMTDAGYGESAYTVLVQNYPSPIPTSGRMRIPQWGPRQGMGGCGMWDADVDWANNVALATINRTVKGAIDRFPQPNNIRFMDNSRALDGHRLCEVGVDLVDNLAFEAGYNPARVDKVEWVNQIRTVSTVGSYQIAEGFHPNFWAQKALRNCVRQAFNGGNPRGGTCVSNGGINGLNEPNMTLI